MAGIRVRFRPYAYRPVALAGLGLALTLAIAGGVRPSPSQAHISSPLTNSPIPTRGQKTTLSQSQHLGWPVTMGLHRCGQDA